MMNLILWRHAEAEDGLDDLARRLTEKGRRQAEKTAAFLHRHLPADVRVLASPAVRTRQTVAAYTDKFTTVDAFAPGASALTILKAARWPDAGGTVLVVGHQPTLGAVAAHLLGTETDSLRIKKGGIWWLTDRDDTAEVVLRLAISPEFL